MVGQGLEAVLALVLIIVLSRAVNKDSFGMYSLIISFISLASVTSLPGITSSLAKNISMGLRVNIFRVLQTSLKYSFLGSIFLVFVSGYFFFFRGSKILSIAILLSAAAFPFLYSFNNCAGGFLIGKKKFVQNTFFSLLNAVCITSAVGITALHSKNPLDLVIAFLLGTAFPNLLIFLLLAKNFRLNRDYSDHPNDTINYSKFLTKIGVLSMIALQIDQLTLGSLLPPETVANYRIASAFTNTTRNFEKSTGNIMLPNFVNHAEEELKRTRAKKTLALVIVGLTIGIGLIILQPFLIPLFFGTAFKNTVFWSQLMALSLIFTPVEIYFSQFLTAFEKKSTILGVSVILPTVKLILTVIFFIFFGATGVILSNAVSRTFNIMYLWKAM